MDMRTREVVQEPELRRQEVTELRGQVQVAVAAALITLALVAWEATDRATTFLTVLLPVRAVAVAVAVSR